MALFVVATVIIGISMLIMAVGVILNNRCLRGSCGGAEVVGPEGYPLTCAACPRRKDLPTTASTEGAGRSGASPHS